MGRVVLVTGVAGPPAAEFARLAAADPSVDKVVGVDVSPPRADMGQVSFVRADIRNPVLAKVIAKEDVDTVVHLSVVEDASGAGGRTSAKELNVIGTMQLLAACQKASGLRDLIVKSSTAVYGSSSGDPAMFTEVMAPRQLPSSGFAKDAAEVEDYVRGFSRRRPDVTVTVLRSADLIGPSVDSPLTRYLLLPVVPTALGFDARLQFLHEDDLVAGLWHAVTTGVHGTFNLAGDGVLMLSQALRRLGRPTLPVPSMVLSQVGPALRRTRLGDFPSDGVRFLAHGRGVNTSRTREVLGLRPERDTEAAFGDFAASVDPGIVSADRVGAVEAAVTGALTAGESRG